MRERHHPRTSTFRVVETGPAGKPWGKRTGMGEPAAGGPFQPLLPGGTRQQQLPKQMSQQTQAAAALEGQSRPLGALGHSAPRTHRLGSGSLIKPQPPVKPCAWGRRCSQGSERPPCSAQGTGPGTVNGALLSGWVGGLFLEEPADRDRAPRGAWEELPHLISAQRLTGSQAAHGT